MAREFLASKGYLLPHDFACARLVYLTDESRQKELMIIFIDDLSAQGLTAAGLKENGAHAVHLGNVEQAHLEKIRNTITATQRLKLIMVEQVTEFDLQLLIPSFAESATIYLSGSKQNIAIEAGKYATLQRTWSGKTQIILNFPMPVVAHQRDGRYALSQGPIVLALDEIQGKAATFENVIPELSSLQKAYWKEPEISFETANQSIWASEQHRVYLKGKEINPENNSSSGELTLVYRPFFEAGTSPWQTFSVWLPMLIPDDDDD